MTDPRPQQPAQHPAHRPTHSGLSMEQRKVDDIVERVSAAFSSELNAIMKRRRGT